MLSEAQITRVWEGMLAAEIRSLYFADLSARYYRNQRLATWGSLMLSSGAAVSILANLPADLVWLRPMFAISAATLSGYTVAMQNQKSAIDSADLHARWNRLSKGYESIWENVYADDAAERLAALDERAADLSKAGCAFGNDEKSMLRWEER